MLFHTAETTLRRRKFLLSGSTSGAEAIAIDVTPQQTAACGSLHHHQNTNYKAGKIPVVEIGMVLCCPGWQHRTEG